MPFWINIAVGLLAFAVAALGGKILIPWLHQLKFGQPIKVEFGPKWHANKQGTPTMGGILFIIGSIIATACGYAMYRFWNATDATAIAGDREALRVLSCIVFCLLFGIIGFIDDFAKVAKKQNERVETDAEDCAASRGGGVMAWRYVLAGRSQYDDRLGVCQV